MAFRITGGSNAEISLALNILNQFGGIMILPRKRSIRIGRDISPKRQNIFNLLLLQFAEYILHLFPGGGNTGQMRQNVCVIAMHQI